MPCCVDHTVRPSRSVVWTLRCVCFEYIPVVLDVRRCGVVLAVGNCCKSCTSCFLCSRVESQAIDCLSTVVPLKKGCGVPIFTGRLRCREGCEVADIARARPHTLSTLGTRRSSSRQRRALSNYRRKGGMTQAGRTRRTWYWVCGCNQNWIGRPDFSETSSKSGSDKFANTSIQR